MPPNTTALTAITVAVRITVSITRSRSAERRKCRLHSTSSGVITSAPATSPSHHVSQIDPYAAHAAYPARASVVTPTVALIVVLARPASTANRNTSAGRLKHSTPPAKRRTSAAPTTASNEFPAAIPSDVRTVPAVVTFTRKAPTNTAGQTRGPSAIAAAMPMPVGGQIAVAFACTTAYASPI